MELRGRVTALEARLGDQVKESKDGAQSLTPQQVTALETAVGECVRLTRDSAPRNSPEYESNFWKGFDAYYNPGSGLVTNNVMYNGQRPALYAFNKCMTTKGMPLGPSRKQP
jgi:hypothetical protein